MPQRISLLLGAAALGVAGAAALAVRTRLRTVAMAAQRGQGSSTTVRPRVAASEAQADVLYRAWESDAELAAFRTKGGRHRHEALVYSDDDGLALYGRLAWATGGGLSLGGTRPGILLVHTAVGPHDLFLHWRAQCLAAQGYVVLIVDCFGDDRGAGWEPTWAAPRRQAFVDDRPLLTHRMQLAMAELVGASSCVAGAPAVDPSRVGAVGFCFGGRAVLDLLRADPDGLRAVVSFHGILDDNPLSAGVSALRARALICHADNDPFVPPEALAALLRQLRAAGCIFDLQMFGGAAVRHGFTNPAQALNERPQFGYDERAARASWESASLFLQEALLPSDHAPDR